SAPPTRIAAIRVPSGDQAGKRNWPSDAVARTVSLDVAASMTAREPSFSSTATPPPLAIGPPGTVVLVGRGVGPADADPAAVADGGAEADPEPPGEAAAATAPALGDGTVDAPLMAGSTQT